RSGVRRPEAPNPLWFAVQSPTNLGTISAPFLAVSHYGFVVYQPLTTTNCTSGANRALAHFGLWTLDFGLWTLDFGLWTLDFGLWTLDLGLWTLDFGRPNRR